MFSPHSTTLHDFWSLTSANQMDTFNFRAIAMNNPDSSALGVLLCIMRRGPSYCLEMANLEGLFEYSHHTIGTVGPFHAYGSCKCTHWNPLSHLTLKMLWKCSVNKILAKSVAMSCFITSGIAGMTDVHSGAVILLHVWFYLLCHSNLRFTWI